MRNRDDLIAEIARRSKQRQKKDLSEYSDQASNNYLNGVKTADICREADDQVNVGENMESG